MNFFFLEEILRHVTHHITLDDCMWVACMRVSMSCTGGSSVIVTRISGSWESWGKEEAIPGNRYQSETYAYGTVNGVRRRAYLQRGTAGCMNSVFVILLYEIDNSPPFIHTTISPSRVCMRG